MNSPRLLSAILSLLLLAASLSAQVYVKQPLLTGLDSPRGVAVDANGDLWFTEVPTPGVPGTMGGTNRVSRLDAQSGAITVVETGMPEPLNVSALGSEVYWTCRTAGVVFRYSPGGNQIFQQGLVAPTGIFATPTGIWVTQVPTPGVPGSQGGTNSVDVIDNGMVTNLSMGEPEPADVVVAANGNAYWTCKTAGVILMRDAQSGMNSVVARGLEQPAGLAIDAAGNLYFTELPTPGIPGTMGGRNKIWKLDPQERVFTLISMGEPEPADIAVTPDGMHLYWSCTTAGVILKADLVGPAPAITSPTTPALGSTLRFFLDAPMHGGHAYIAGSSYELGPTPLGNQFVALDDDELLYASVMSQGSPVFVNYQGMLDAHGMATVHLAVPNSPSLAGLDFYTAFVVIDMNAPNGVAGISGSRLVTLP